MEVIIEIIIGRLMRETLTKQRCQLVIKMLGMNKGYLLALQAPI